ncbi:MAG: DNA polymerase III subunit delta', partial [Nostoc sp.]
MNPFAPVVGQQQAIELLTQAVRQNRVAPAYLFVGPDGVGRSLAARCFVELLFSSGMGV